MDSQDEGRDQKPLAWRIFGLQQKRLRSLRGLTQEQLADRSKRGYSLSTVQKVESGSIRPTPDYIQDADEALEADGLLLVLGEDLVRPEHPMFFQEYAEAESSVQRLFTYDNHAINGLLQTEAHARAVLSARVPLLEDDQISDRIQARIDRQQLLTRRPAASLCFVIEEQVLRRPMGGTAVHKEQLEHLAACAGMRNVDVHVMPNEVETHVGLDGPMILLTTEEGRPVVYVEYQGGGSTFYSSPKDVGVLELRYGMIRSHALRAPESLEFIRKLAGEL